MDAPVTTEDYAAALVRAGVDTAALVELVRQAVAGLFRAMGAKADITEWEAARVVMLVEDLAQHCIGLRAALYDMGPAPDLELDSYRLGYRLLLARLEAAASTAVFEYAGGQGWDPGLLMEAINQATTALAEFRRAESQAA